MTEPYTFTRIGYVYVPTSDIDRSIDWYTRNLSFKLINKFEDRGSMMAVLHQPHKHAIALLLIETAEPDRLQINRNGSPFPVMAVQCPDIELTYRTLTNNGVEAEPIQTLGAGEARYFYFRDDQGNLLEAAWSIWDPEDEFKEEAAG
ncbi:VOC family protein [Paenibacillus sp. CN-4]|uniref:VOC family protein n=1 Tax=Paenibacillus nanchangensis TaxID=3348343 RepID=UPI00397B598F